MYIKDDGSSCDLNPMVVMDSMKEPPFFKEKMIAYDSQYHYSRSLLAKIYTKNNVNL
jgi:hypothetical protein